MRANCFAQARRTASCSSGRTSNSGFSESGGQRTRSPSNCSSTSVIALWMRSAISPAAFSVKVTRTMRSGASSSFPSSSFSTSATMAVVFPVPAPASITTFRRNGAADLAAVGKRNICCWGVVMAASPAECGDPSAGPRRIAPRRHASCGRNDSPGSTCRS